MKLNNTGGHVSGLTNPGDFTFEQGYADLEPTGLCFVNPACKFNKCCIKIRKNVPADHPYFFWDGNRESPTISPSIGCDARCGWHGNITAGILSDKGGKEL